MKTRNKLMYRSLPAHLILALSCAACAAPDADLSADPAGGIATDPTLLPASDETISQLQISGWRVEPTLDHETHVVALDLDQQLHAELVSTEHPEDPAGLIDIEVLAPEAAHFQLASDGSIQGEVSESVRQLTTAFLSDMVRAESEGSAADSQIRSLRQPLSDAVVSKFQNDLVGFEKRIATTANLYPSGLLVLDSSTANHNWVSGLRGRTLIVVLDAQNQPIWVSHVFEDPTRCSVPDWSCASSGRLSFVETLPEPVGRLSAALDIYHGDDANFVDLRSQFVTGIRAARDIAQEIKSVVSQLLD